MRFDGLAVWRRLSETDLESRGSGRRFQESGTKLRNGLGFREVGDLQPETVCGQEGTVVQEMKHGIVGGVDGD